MVLYFCCVKCVLTVRYILECIFIAGTTQESETLFQYFNGRSYQYFVADNADFRPKFLDEANQTLVAEAETFCNGPTDQPCIFDYVFTQNPEVAENTAGTQTQAKINNLEVGKLH